MTTILFFIVGVLLGLVCYRITIFFRPKSEAEIMFKRIKKYTKKYSNSNNNER